MYTGSLTNVWHNFDKLNFDQLICRLECNKSVTFYSNFLGGGGQVRGGEEGENQNHVNRENVRR